MSKTVKSRASTVTIVTRRGDHVMPDVYSDTAFVFAIGQSSADAISMCREIALADPFQRAPKAPRTSREVFKAARK
jgi:hypothetical protein